MSGLKNQDTHPLRDGCFLPNSANNRQLIRERGKQNRLNAQERFQTLPPEDRSLICKKYRSDRLAGKTVLQFSRWLIKLFELADAGMSVRNAIPRLNLYLAGKLDGLPLQRASGGNDPNRPSRP